jgi:RNA exonuclease 1
MTSSTLEIAALDCEMVYTTGGFRIARVSVVNAGGEEVFDELIKMDDGVEVVDFNTRFSGIHPDEYATGAVLPLESVLRALGRLIGSDTILIGHALDNDLRALRLVHQRVIDTAALFPHSRGLPYRRALRDLMKEHISRPFREGDASRGHSSVEDSVAALDLVKWFVLNKKTKPAFKLAPVSSGGGGSSPVAALV